MAATIPAEYAALLNQPIVVSLATVMPDGQPQVNPVWCSYDGTHVLINSAAGRVKDRNMKDRPQATVLCMDPQNPFKWVEVRGKVVEITTEGADDHIDDLAELYLGQRPYPFRQADEVRVIYKIEPTRVVSFG
jgi:PPOX class probable F420-dependent enzyme